MSSKVDVDSDLNAIARKMVVLCEQDEAKIARKIAREAKARAPRLNRVIVHPSGWRRPGYMAQQINVEEIAGGHRVDVDVFYGLFVERGTPNMAAQPFLEPAAIANEMELVEDVAKSLRRL